ncbi:hypothetical protein [Bradyrhizobium sp. SZCCHNS3002]|nr:hypothetical protein [Bradyrhizobium sp. SZCCHNS3002]
MTQHQIDARMQRLMIALDGGKITQAEFEAHLDALRKEIPA